MLKKMAFTLLSLLIAGSLTACTFGGVSDPSLPSAEEIINAVVEAMSGVRSYQFESSMVMDASGEAGCEAFEMTMDMTLTGAVDIDNRQMGTEITMGAEMPGQVGMGDMDIEMSMYVVDDTVYMKMAMFGFDEGWMKMEMTDRKRLNRPSRGRRYPPSPWTTPT